MAKLNDRFTGRGMIQPGAGTGRKGLGAKIKDAVKRAVDRPSAERIAKIKPQVAARKQENATLRDRNLKRSR